MALTVLIDLLLLLKQKVQGLQRPLGCIHMCVALTAQSRQPGEGDGKLGTQREWA
jgi:hypothetical protein